ncbi:MAG: tetratricopeptide repeat protein [Phycisphaerales bacterium]|nr:tetratricopeptide repeat protein [Phycisphaerales bacterium]
MSNSEWRIGLYEPSSARAERPIWRPCFLLLTLIVVPLFMVLVRPAGASADDDLSELESDDRLPREERRLVSGLIQRGMPELVEMLLVDYPPIHRVFVARAYAKAGIDEKSPDHGESFFAKAAEEYRKIIGLARRADWLRGERRRFKLTAWRVEFGDMILRHWIVPELDRFEITSGQDFDREKVFRLLEEAYSSYIEAGEMLKDLDIGLRTDEERYLLLGIADKITALLAQQELNVAWAGLYLGMMSPDDAPERWRHFNRSLSAFDLISHAAQDSNRKYNALLGAGIALRELRRFDEAVSVFDRIFDSTASRALTTRASYEKARTLILADRFDLARRELDRLALQPTRRLGRNEAGALFYVRLAPLIHAYTYIRQAQVSNGPEDRRKEYQQKAKSELNELYERGEPWSSMARIYLDAMIGKKRDLEELTGTELAMTAAGMMAKQEYKQAIRAWKLLLQQDDAKQQHHKARFNLGVCFFQTGELRAAAEVFLSEAKTQSRSTITEKTFEYAYRCWRELAASAKSREDYLKLAEASALLAKELPGHRLAEEASWVAALALEEAGEYLEARVAYGRVPRPSVNYWPARRNMARCWQRLYEALPTDATASHRQRNARRVADAWLKLAEGLAALGDSKSAGSGERPKGKDEDFRSPAVDAEVRATWINEARLAAAAVMASEDLREYEACQSLLDQMPRSARVLGLHIRCLQGKGDIKQANRVLEGYLKQDSGAELGSVLVGLAAEMELEIQRLRQEGRRGEAKRMAIETIPTIRHLLDWVQARPKQKKHLSIVRFSLIKTLVQAEEYEEATGQLDALITENPKNGTYIRTAALLQEDIAKSGAVSVRGGALDQAESLWAKLLTDPSLRTTAPAHYWEARYHWLKHQLRHGHAAAVVKGIESEKAWRPDLGGPPWQGRLLDLAEQAQARVEADSS